MTVYLVKAAEAVSRGSWSGPTNLRPLSSEGRRQARALVKRLKTQPISRILTGPDLRCRETVLPLADSRGLTVEFCAALGHVATAAGALDAILDAADRPLLVCAHSCLVDSVISQLVLDGWRNDDGGSLTDGILWLLDEGARAAS